MTTDRSKPWPIYIAILGLAFTTTFSCLLLASSLQQWTFPSATYRWIVLNRATVQLLLQLLSNALALTQITVLTILINNATRILWRKRSISLDTLRFWHGLCVRTVSCNTSVLLLLPLLVFIILTAIFPAIWTGALTPVATTQIQPATVLLPGYANSSAIQEYPSEIGSQGPTLRSSKGLFSYSVGMVMQGSLLASASSSTPVDKLPRRHTKLDNSQFIYVGRSYGAASSVGLMDDTLLDDELHITYSYHEIGYDTTVSCIHNASSDFLLRDNLNGAETALYSAEGSLPNSGSAGPELSTYVGHGTSAIVAIGVGRNPSDPRRMLAIAAGESYKHLDRAQCTMHFVPALFNVSVATSGRNISVVRVKAVDHFNDGGNLTQVLMRQFELIANDQTNLYVSLVGNSFNESISNYMIANKDTTLDDATLRGLENALMAMVDDMLVAYASAQLMIQKDSVPTTAILQSAALRVGEDKYIYAIFVINAIVLFLVAVEASRTRLWAGVPVVDYLDPSGIILASTSSGNGNGAGHGKNASYKAQLFQGSRIAINEYDHSLDQYQALRG